MNYIDLMIINGRLEDNNAKLQERIKYLEQREAEIAEILKREQKKDVRIAELEEFVSAMDPWLNDFEVSKSAVSYYASKASELLK